VRGTRGWPECGRAAYDSLARNYSAVQLVSNEELRVIATELVLTVRNNTGVVWWKRDSLRARSGGAGAPAGEVLARA